MNKTGIWDAAPGIFELMDRWLGSVAPH
jgi:hypothetical protein